MEKKVLFIIDVQNDFMDLGRLGVEGSKKKMDSLAKYIFETKGQYDAYFASVDWHPSSHCSFSENGGMWPVHCRQYSEGAAIYQPILDAIDNIHADLHVFKKGTNEDREEYSVMKNSISNKKIHSFIEANGIDSVDFCGVAGDFCVKDSVDDFHREFPDISIRVLLPFVPSIDDGTTLAKFLHNNETIESVEMV